MSDPYDFEVGSELFLGYTVPGCARMRIHRQSDDKFIAAFDPELDFAARKIKTGIWSDLRPDTDFALLQKLAPVVLATCERRLQAIVEENARHGKQLMPDEDAQGEGGFDDNYFLE